MAMKKDLRALTLGKKKVFREREVEYSGATFVFKQVTRGEKMDLLSACKNEDGNLDTEKFGIMAMIATCRDENGDFVFESTDLEAILASPTEKDDYVDLFVVEAMKVIGLIPDEESEKN